MKAGKVLTVEPKTFRALLFLLHNPQRLISKEELLNTVWGDAAVTEGSLTRCIWLLPIAVLEAAAPHELGTTPKFGLLSLALYPVYVRGEAYLAEHSGSEAAAEFQKILDHRGVVGNELIGALAHLGLARAYALQADIVKAHAAYQDFLSLERR